MIASHSPYPPCVWLADTPPCRDLTGGKGASLSELMALGAPAPPAFAVTAPAYAAFVAGLCVSAMDATPAAMQRAMLTAPLPPALGAALAENWAAMQARAGADVALAVRSSATVEDGAEHSFAGQHDTILGVRTLPELEAALRQCWASLWSERAVSYRRGALIAAEPQMAVVVQQMIRSDVSFIAFTDDPLGARPGCAVISAAWGLGESLVSGLVTPDQIVVAPDGAVVERQIGDKQIMVIPDASGAGTREVAVPRLLRTAPALTDAQAGAIATLAREVAGRLGYAADFEGAIANGEIVLFQARPITTLADLPLAGD
ncbi:MAG: PEP/pyruvate-binding domain-containing protein [Thermomicrobiales bacterium]